MAWFQIGYNSLLVSFLTSFLRLPRALAGVTGCAQRVRLLRGFIRVLPLPSIAAPRDQLSAFRRKLRRLASQHPGCPVFYLPWRFAFPYLQRCAKEKCPRAVVDMHAND